MLVMGRAQGTVLREAQDHRNEPPGRLHHLRKLAWISDPVNGSRHDNYCREESGVLLTINPRNWIGDKGYIGNNMITPFRKPAGGELLDWQKEYNSEVNKDTLDDRASDLALQKLDHHAHRLPAPA